MGSELPWYHYTGDHRSIDQITSDGKTHQNWSHAVHRWSSQDSLKLVVYTTISTIAIQAKVSVKDLSTKKSSLQAEPVLF